MHLYEQLQANIKILREHQQRISQERSNDLPGMNDLWFQQNPKTTTKMELEKQLEASGTNECTFTINRVLHIHSLKGWGARKKPLF